MSNVLNKYITSWVANRTLSSGVVTVSKNPYSDEAVDVEFQEEDVADEEPEKKEEKTTSKRGKKTEQN